MISYRILQSVHGTVTYLDGDSLLVIGSSWKDLRFFGWDNRVSWNDFGHDTTYGFNTQGQWADIQKDNTISITFSRENTSLEK